MLNLIEVFLKKVEFNCIREIILANQNLSMQSNININSKFSRKERILSVILEITGKGVNSNNIEPLNFIISVEGIFKLDIHNSLNDNAMEIISKVKAPQLLFPFVLENIQSLTAKAGIKPVVLPIIDFEKIYYENKKFEEEKIIN